MAEGILSAPVNIMCSLCKAEHQLLEVFVTASANAYVVRKIRKTLYKLQKFGLVLTYEDDAKGEWHMLMPDSVRDSLADFVPQFMNYINAGQPIPSAKEIRMRMALHRFLDGGMLDSKMTYCCLHIWTLEGKIHEGYFPFISQSVIIDVVSDMYVSGSFWVIWLSTDTEHLCYVAHAQGLPSLRITILETCIAAQI